jgi:hypothetical protein
MKEYQKIVRFQKLLWQYNSDGQKVWYEPLCPEHRIKLVNQEQYRSGFEYEENLTCRMDGKTFHIPQGMYGTSEVIVEIQNSHDIMHAKVYDLDNVYTPVLKVEPKPKDKRFSVQVEIDTTKEGKKLVIYAADRDNLAEKTQIFIDPQLDKITFDGTGDIHPNMIFSKVVAYFKDNKSATLEKDDTVARKSKN